MGSCVLTICNDEDILYEDDIIEFEDEITKISIFIIFINKSGNCNEDEPSRITPDSLSNIFCFKYIKLLNQILYYSLCVFFLTPQRMKQCLMVKT